jgi:UDP-2-acetamido-2,6-beta-L-arabino-hexul-4-ose reductase
VFLWQFLKNQELTLRLMEHQKDIIQQKIKIGITGQIGFMGTHLFNYLKIKDEFELIPFEDRFFENDNYLFGFVKQCDVVVHLAAMNRHEDPQVIFDTNLLLVKKLIDSMESTHSKPHIIFSSSTQEEKDNLYGASKREGRKLFEEWAKRVGARFTGFIIPNVFGPFGKPFYNSVIATFCHQICNNQSPQIQVDGELKLIYINELCNEFYKALINRKVATIKGIEEYKVPHTSEKKVSQILEILTGFKENYIEKGIFPDLTDPFTRNLFNTFVCYSDIKNYFPVHLKLNTDERGSFVETIKLNSGGQVSFSTTMPGITRGNHFHIRKAERFAVIKGKALIQLRKYGTDEVLNFELDGKHPAYVDMPIWYTHNIKNIGQEDLYTIFWISEHYNPNDPDTFYENV